MKQNLKVFLILIILIAIAGVLAFLGYRGRQVTPNPTGTVGNTGGNLYNSGLFCEYNNTVYFANPKDRYSLYSMTADEQNVTKMTDSEVCNILAGGKYIYYFQKASHDDSMGNVRISRAFFRCDLDGSHATSLTSDTVVLGQLVDNYLYLLTAQNNNPLFYKMKIDKSEKEILADYAVYPASAQGGHIYYNGTVGNHFLYSLNTLTEVSSELLQGNIWFPIADGDYVYYIDAENNYRLCRYCISQKTVDILTEDRIECYNVGNGYIYYQCNSSTVPALKMMRNDGSGLTTIAEGNYTNINMTSKFVYFQEFGKPTSLYHTEIGSATYSSM